MSESWINRTVIIIFLLLAVWLLTHPSELRIDPLPRPSVTRTPTPMSSTSPR